MRCVFCGHKTTRVIDKRDSGEITRRRRICLKCKQRFSTQESALRAELRVIKRDGHQEQFSSDKVKKGIILACEKRPISMEQIEEIVARVESKLLQKKTKNVRSIEIGEIVMKELKRLDKVAYVRFASVYLDFKDVRDFTNEVKELTKH